ncbi:glycogen synthase [bacterium E08(2017)]|nr:glycogen synthase [bacterium E08(2017)]
MKHKKNPRILIVTPEITYLPEGMGNMANRLSAKAGGLADVSASLVAALFELHADVHVALPHYRRMFHIEVAQLINNELRVYKTKLPDDRIHLAEDRSFYYRNEVYSNYLHDSPKLALAFQREVINNIVPRVKPDLIHCNDWMTGLIPAMARRMNIPCLFTVHNIHTHKITLDEIEDRGIDAAEFWPHLYYTRPPANYEETRFDNPVDLLASGIFAAHFVNSVSPTFLMEVVEGKHEKVPQEIRQEMAAKLHAGCAEGILNAPDNSFDPENDPFVPYKYNAENHATEKAKNKTDLQRKLGLEEDANAPMLFWPSRLDPVQKGCQLLAEILYSIVDKYWKKKLQVVVVANGEYQQPFHDIVNHHGFHNRVAVRDFDEGLSHHAYAAADFVLMPSLFEPCGLPQMVGSIYGSLPIVHDTGGLHDTVKHIDLERNFGNGFVFKHYDANGFSWAIDQAMSFYKLPKKVRNPLIEKIMRDSATRFSHETTAKKYFKVYEKMLKRPLVDRF